MPLRVDTKLLGTLDLTVFIALIFRSICSIHMDQTLQQLGELLLGSVPTVILLALLYALYTAIVHKPLQRVLDERRSKTEGAVEKSRADIAAAEARTAEYEQKLREARAAVFQRAGSAAAGGAAGAHRRGERSPQQGPGAGAGCEKRY